MLLFQKVQPDISLDLRLIVARNSNVSRVLQSKFIVGSDPANSMMCFPHGAGDSTFFLKIKELSSHMDLVFCHVVRLANSKADALAKQGVDPRVVSIL